ncbi:type II toxin-antitoxin system YoeB family toxin [Streptomyces nitrosporeus]|uniref:type II toxin-antitoxin system YoeB family toxin n=1 Tax=Streptomyces nitrosporeus TaxID=28894 RepID=UPI00399F85A1
MHITSREGNAALRSEEDFASWQERIWQETSRLTTATLRDPFEGTGEPEPPPRGDLSGHRYRRTDDEHRSVCRAAESGPIITQARYRYG